MLCTDPTGKDAPMTASSWSGADTMRSFSFSLDLRSFQAGRRLPLSLASAYVVAHLPKELIGVAGVYQGSVLKI